MIKSIGFVSAHAWRNVSEQSSEITKIVAHAASLEPNTEISSSYDAYASRGFMVLVGWGYHDSWIVYFPRGAAPVYHRMQHEDIYELRGMPFNWDIPF